MAGRWPEYVSNPLRAIQLSKLAAKQYAAEFAELMETMTWTAIPATEACSE